MSLEREVSAKKVYSDRDCQFCDGTGEEPLKNYIPRPTEIMPRACMVCNGMGKEYDWDES